MLFLFNIKENVNVLIYVKVPKQFNFVSLLSTLGILQYLILYTIIPHPTYLNIHFHLLLSYFYQRIFSFSPDIIIEGDDDDTMIMMMMMT